LKEPLVSFVVVNHNGEKMLSDCLNSIDVQSYSNKEIIVVDNASTDNSTKKLENKNRKNSKIKIIKNSSNLGFCQANNQGIAEAKGEFIAMVNNDVILEKNWLKILVAKAITNNKIGMLTGKRFFPDGNLECKGLSTSKALNSVPEKISEKIFCVDDGACLYRKEMLNDIDLGNGVYDEDLFIYHEDFDIGLRARARGWKAEHCPKAVAFHKHSATTSSMGNMKPFFLNRNNHLVIMKNAPKRVLLFNSPWILSRQLKDLIIESLNGNSLTFLSAKVASVPMVPKMLSKRSKIQKNRKISANEFSSFL